MAIRGIKDLDQILTTSCRNIMAADQRAVLIMTFDGKIHIRADYKSEPEAVFLHNMEMKLRAVLKEFGYAD